MELPKNTDIIKHAIKLKDSKHPPYKPIYNSRLVELEILKTYIKIYLKTGFFQSFKSLIRAPILFNKKLDSSLWLYIDY